MRVGVVWACPWPGVVGAVLSCCLSGFTVVDLRLFGL